jgi:2,3-dihydroxybenzoate-AMP ligase
MPVKAVQPCSAGTVPWPDEAVARYIAKGYWSGRPLGEHLYATAAATPDAVCLIDGDTQLTYGELMDWADGAAARMRAAGLRADDRIIVQLPNCWELIVLMVACVRLGVIPVMSLPADRRQEITAVANHAEARALLVPDSLKDFDYQAMAHEVAANVPTLEHILVVGDQVRPGSIDARALCRPAEDVAQTRKELDESAPVGSQVALFFLSGGTTGLPKLIARTHNDFTYMASRAAELCGLDRSTIYLAVLPLGHGYPMSGPGVMGTLLTGGRVIILPSPAPERAFAAIEHHRVTVTSLVPAAAKRWMEHREADQSHDLSSLQLLQVAGSRLADHLALQVMPVFGCTLQQVYGMAEGLLCFTRLDDPHEVLCHTQGRPICPDDELLMVDEDGKPVAPGEAGILLTRGPYTPRGYYRAEELNARAFFGDGWYSTGDIVRQRPDGNLIIEGRDKDVINRGGEKVWAEEIEGYAYQVPGVSLAAAVAMPDAELGEQVCLYIVPSAGASVELADVRQAMENVGVAAFKMPQRVVLIEAMPLTIVGKIDKKALRADISQRLAAEHVTEHGAEAPSP